MEKGKKGKSEGGGKYSSVGLAWLGDSEGGGALQISNIRKKKMAAPWIRQNEMF